MHSSFQSPIDRLRHWVTHSPEKVFLRQPKGDQWHELTFEQTWDRAARLASHLKKYPERSRIGIFSLNCADWFVVDIAILMAGHISVPIYPTAGRSTINFIVEHAELPLVFVGKLFDWDDKKDCFSKTEVISFFQQKSQIASIDDIVSEHQVLESIYPLTGSDTMTIAYTSGTTGQPKGVMMNCHSVSAAIDSVSQVFTIDQTDRFFSYLPLAHVAERMVVEMASIYFGASVSFVDSIDQFAKNLRSVKPTIFFAVPRIWFKLKHRIESLLGGRKVASLILSVPIIGGFLKRTIIKLIGLDQARLSLSAAASLPKDTLDWFESMGVIICEAYGLTETNGFSHINLPDARKAGTVGRPFPGAQCTLADNGEVLLSNPSLMEGYYKMPELTAQAIQDGWFRTGDLGKIDSDGFLSITGRVKEIFKTSKGKYISPTPIENKLQPLIQSEHLCVMGMNLPQPVAVAVVLAEWSDDFKSRFEQNVKKALEEVNRSLEKHERVERIIIAKEDWTTENNLLTPTLKMRRQQIEERFSQIAMETVNDRATVIWSAL